MTNQKISTISAIMLTLSIVVSYITSSLPRTFINETKSATLLNIIYNTIIVLFIILLVCKLFKKFPGLDILDISKFLGGNILKNIVGGLFIAYFIISSSLMLRNFCEALGIVYLEAMSVGLITIGCTNQGISEIFDTKSMQFVDERNVTQIVLLLKNIFCILLQIFYITLHLYNFQIQMYILFLRQYQS